MKNISIVNLNKNPELEDNNVIQYMHSDDPDAINTQIEDKLYEEIRNNTKTTTQEVKNLIDIILFKNK